MVSHIIPKILSQNILSVLLHLFYAATFTYFLNIHDEDWHSICDTAIMLVIVCNQCLSPLMLWVRISITAGRTTLCDKVYQWLGTGRWFSSGPLVSSTNENDRHNINEILLKVHKTNQIHLWHVWSFFMHLLIFFLLILGIVLDSTLHRTRKKYL
jgi:hypothetical protein